MPPYQIHPLSPDRWPDLEALFGPNGADSGCWCMFPRQSSAEFTEHHGEDNRRALRRLTARTPPGLLAYDGDIAVGWVSLGPRQDFPRVQRSRITKPVDETPTWSIVCFFIKPGRRGTGVGSALLSAAVRHAEANGAKAIEGYPLDKDRAPNADAFWGTAVMFRRAGFEEIARRSPTRPVMRLRL